MTFSTNDSFPTVDVSVRFSNDVSHYAWNLGTAYSLTEVMLLIQKDMGDLINSEQLSSLKRNHSCDVKREDKGYTATYSFLRRY